jgi:hypothetical protein
MQPFPGIPSSANFLPSAATKQAMTEQQRHTRQGQSLITSDHMSTCLSIYLSIYIAIMRLKGLSQLKKYNDLIRNRTLDLLACSIVS